MDCRGSLLVGTLNSQGIKFMNICENKVFENISEFMIFKGRKTYEFKKWTKKLLFRFYTYN